MNAYVLNGVTSGNFTRGTALVNRNVARMGNGAGGSQGGPAPSPGDSTGGGQQGGGSGWIDSALNTLENILGGEVGGFFQGLLGGGGGCSVFDHAENGPSWCGVPEEIHTWFTKYGPTDFLTWMREQWPEPSGWTVSGWKNRVQNMDLVYSHLYLWLLAGGWMPPRIYAYIGTKDPKFPAYYWPGFTENTYGALGVDFWPTLLSSEYFGGPGFVLVTLPSGTPWTTQQAAQQAILNPKPPGGGGGGGSADPLAPGPGGPPADGSTSNLVLPLALLYFLT